MKIHILSSILALALLCCACEKSDVLDTCIPETQVPSGSDEPAVVATDSISLHIRYVGDSLTAPRCPGGGRIDWGDGTSGPLESGQVHTYAADTVHDVRIRTAQDGCVTVPSLQGVQKIRVTLP